jgi:hypothetical protein
MRAEPVVVSGIPVFCPEAWSCAEISPLPLVQRCGLNARGVCKALARCTCIGDIRTPQIA